MPFDNPNQIEFAPSGAPASPSSPVVRVLRDARARIANEANWSPCGGGDGTNTLCVSYAARAAANNVVLWEAAFKALRRALPDPWRDHGTSVVAFNDAPETTHADVLALFDAAISLAEREPT